MATKSGQGFGEVSMGSMKKIFAYFTKPWSHFKENCDNEAYYKELLHAFHIKVQCLYRTNYFEERMMWQWEEQ